LVERLRVKESHHEEGGGDGEEEGVFHGEDLDAGDSEVETRARRA
jgi:hypothetical protein